MSPVLASDAAAGRSPAVPGNRFAPGIRVGRPALVRSPRTGAPSASAMRQPPAPPRDQSLPGEPEPPGEPAAPRDQSPPREPAPSARGAGPTPGAMAGSAAAACARALDGRLGRNHSEL